MAPQPKNPENAVINPHLEEQMELKSVVMGPPGYGSPDINTSAGYLAPLVDHPLRSTFNDHYGTSVEEVEVAPLTTDYNEMKVEQLKNLARAREISGFSTMDKSELIEALEADDELGDDEE